MKFTTKEIIPGEGRVRLLANKGSTFYNELTLKYNFN